ncbi:MAG: Crp/Fnr family transcriptional regulator [Bythopirellula sp.]
MNVQSMTEEFRNSSFFNDFPDAHLQELVEIARPVEYRAREEMFHEHEPAKDVFLITSGQVALVICEAGLGCRQIMAVKQGDMIGWSPLLDRPRLSDTARTLTPVKAIAMDGAKLLELCEQNPQFGYHFMRRTAKVLSERLNAVRWQLVDVHGTNLPEVALESD